MLAALKMSYCLPKLAAIPKGILNTISMPQHVAFRQIRQKDKLVHTFHGVPTSSREGLLAGKCLSSAADAIVSVSSYCASFVKAYYHRDSTVIYNGVDTQFYRPVDHSNERLKILCVGRLVNWKRPDWFVQLAKAFPDCDFVLHGKGPMALELKQLSTNLPNLKIETSFTSRNCLRNLYAGSDIFLFPSTDWSPLVVLEAMSCGLPLLLHKIGGQIECIENGKEGLLAGSFHQMSNNLRYLLEEENIRREMSRNSRSRSFSFDWSIVAKQYARLFEEIG
jgi:glycosyltransferase involved in cell wall biosynthesis